MADKERVRDTINDNHVPSRPGKFVYIGLIVVIVGVIAIMMSNKLVPPTDNVGSPPETSAPP
jgi:hypothetical protein